MWPLPPHTSTQTPRCVWDKHFPLFSCLSQRKTTHLNVFSSYCHCTCTIAAACTCASPLHKVFLYIFCHFAPHTLSWRQEIVSINFFHCEDCVAGAKVDLWTCSSVAQHRVLARETGVRYHGPTVTQGLKNNWVENAAFVTTLAHG